MTKLHNKNLYDEDIIDIDIDYQSDIIADSVINIDDLSDDWSDELDNWCPEADEFFRQYRAEQHIFDY